MRISAAIMVCAVLMGCAGPATSVDGGADALGVTQAAALPVAKWDGLPRAERWTEASLAALRDHGEPLVALVPEDAQAWCPAYASASPAARRAFWVGLLSALAEHESTWRPDAVGGGGRWFGLVQISPATARGYGCTATTGEALSSGPANLSCAIRIWTETVRRDGVIAADGEGIAADWGPFNQPMKRESMRDWVRRQPYCAAP